MCRNDDGELKDSRVTKETFKPLLDEKLIDDGASTGSVGDSDTLLDNVRRELLSGESRNVSEELANDSLDESVVVQIENVLNNVVTLQCRREDLSL